MSGERILSLSLLFHFLFTPLSLPLDNATLHKEGAEDGGEDGDDELNDGFPIDFHG